MKTTAALLAVLLLSGASAMGWDGSASNKSLTELEQMTDEQLLEEGVSVCVKAGRHESAALDYLRSITKVVRERHAGYSHPEFSDLLAAAAAQNAHLCRKAAQAAHENEHITE